MLRNIITIDREMCNGCGLCVSACREGAIGMVDGRAVLLRDDYCDGLGECLPVCPTGAITFEEREAAPYNEAEGKRNMEQKELPCGCPGTHAKSIQRDTPSQPSRLNQWPVQIRLVPVNAAFFNNAHLLVAADCAAYAHGGFHQDFMRDKITLIGCPKLDDCDYGEKLTAILRANDIKSVTVARMEVPCCRGIETAVKTALRDCGKMIPWQTAVIGTGGGVVED